VLPWHWYRQEDGMKGFGISLGVAALPRTGRGTPPRIHTRRLPPVGQHRAVIRGAECHQNLLASEPVDSLEASWNWWIGVLAFEGAEAFDELPSVALAKHWPPHLNRLRETGKAVARAAVDGCEILSNGRGGQVQLSRRGFEMSFEIGHEIQDDAVDIEHHQLQQVAEQLHRAPLLYSGATVVVCRCESGKGAHEGTLWSTARHDIHRERFGTPIAGPKRAAHTAVPRPSLPTLGDNRESAALDWVVA
jgi:hypothetical protein